MKSNKLYFEYMNKIWKANKQIAIYSNPKSRLTPEQITEKCTALEREIQFLEYEMCRLEIEKEDELLPVWIPWYKEKFAQGIKPRRKYSSYKRDEWQDFDFIRVWDKQLTINY